VAAPPILPQHALKVTFSHQAYENGKSQVAEGGWWGGSGGGSASARGTTAGAGGSCKYRSKDSNSEGVPSEGQRRIQIQIEGPSVVGMVIKDPKKRLLDWSLGLSGSDGHEFEGTTLSQTSNLPRPFPLSLSLSLCFSLFLSLSLSHTQTCERESVAHACSM
jgi:hypothetical protein